MYMYINTYSIRNINVFSYARINVYIYIICIHMSIWSISLLRASTFVSAKEFGCVDHLVPYTHEKKRENLHLFAHK